MPGGHFPSTIENERTESTVSASPEKKSRSSQRREEEQKDRRSVALYSAVGLAVIVFAVVLMFWNSGLLQRNLTALDLNGTKYSAADVQYYYNSVYASYANQYAFDPNTSVKKQVYREEAQLSWYDYLLDQALKNLRDNAALSAKAKAEGFSITPESQTELDAFLAQLNTAWLSYGYNSREAFIKASFGAYMTYDRLAELVGMEYLAADYAQSKLDAIDHPQADYDAYYQEHTDELDTIVYSQFTFRASLPATDDQGNPMELSDEEKASKLELMKLEQKALADELKAKLEDGAKAEDLAQEYKDQLYSSVLSRRSTGSSASASYYSEWLLDPGRKAGDVTLSGQDLDGASIYYVAIFEERLLDQDPTSNVRRILVQAGDSGSAPTQAQYDEAEKKAQELLDQWKAGEATEDSFAALATSESTESATAQLGGLVSNITPTSNHGEEFLNWSTDPARQEGDTGLVKAENGWYVTYYSSSGDPIWRQTAAYALQEQDFNQLADDAAEGWTTSTGMGMNFVKA